MGTRGLAAAVALIAAAGAAAWLLLGDGGGPSPGGAGPDVGTGAGGSGISAESGEPAPVAAGGRVEGILLREGRPHPGVVTAWLVDRGPPDPASFASWDAWWDRGNPLFAGLEPAPRGTAAAGADGRWSMAGLGPGVHHFLAAADGGLRGRGTEDVVPSGAALAKRDGAPRDPLRIDLAPSTCVLRGRILGEGGVPWKGWGAVRTGTYEGGDPPPVAVDAEGRFSIGDLPPGRVRLAALEPGVRERGGPFVLLPCPVEVVFTVGSGSLAGNVVEDLTGKPVPLAEVRAAFADANGEEWGEEAVAADAEGRFVLHPPAEGACSLAVEAKGFRPGRVEEFELPFTGDGGPVVRLRRPSSLSGRVIAAGTGAPVAGARVVHGDRGGDRLAETLSGPDGRFEMVDLEPGAGTIRATADGWISRSLASPGVRFEEVLLVEGAALEKDVVVVPSPRVRGRVLDAAGRPAAGVRVLLEPESRDGVPGELDTVAEDLEGTVDTAADGTFRTPCLVPWVEYVAIASVNGIPLARGGPLVLAPGEEGKVEIRLPPERFLDVRVVAGPDAPAAEGTGLEVLLVGDRPWNPESLASGILPAGGVLRMGPLPPGKLQVHAEAAVGEAEGRATVEAGADGEVLVVLAGGDVPGARTVEGRVLLPDGTPASGATVEVVVLDEEGEESFERRIDADDVRGAFRLDGVPPGPTRINAWLRRGDRHHSGSAEVPAAEGAIELVLEPGDRIVREEEAGHRFEVRVTGPDGAPVPRAGVEVRAREGNDWEGYDVSMEGGRGAVVLGGSEPPGTIFVEVRAAADGAGRPLPLAHGVFGPFEGSAGSAEIRLAASSSIEGRVLAPSGEGLESVKVSAEPIYAGMEGGEEWSPPDAAEAVTGPGGAFRLERLGAGPYRLQASGWPLFSPAIPVETRGGSTGVDVRLRPATAVSLRVLDDEGRPLEGARVDADVNGASANGEAVTGTAGTVRIHGLDPEGEYRLSILPPAGRDDLLRTSLKAWRPADGEFRLARAHVLEVLVQDPAGKPVPAAAVEYLVEGGKGWRRETTNGEGVAAIERLSAGRIQLRARLAEDFRAEPLRTEAAASASAGKVVLVLDPGPEVRIRADGTGLDGWLLEPGDAEPSRRVTERPGEVVFRGIKEGTPCTVYVRERRTGRYALLRGVAPAGEPREVPLVGGKEIRLHVSVPEGGRLQGVAVLVDGAELIRQASWEEEDVLISGVPAGRWTVRVEARLPGAKENVVREVSAEAGAAEPVEIEFR